MSSNNVSAVLNEDLKAKFEDYADEHDLKQGQAVRILLVKGLHAENPSENRTLLENTLTIAAQALAITALVLLALTSQAHQPALLMAGSLIAIVGREYLPRLINNQDTDTTPGGDTKA